MTVRVGSIVRTPSGDVGRVLAIAPGSRTRHRMVTVRTRRTDHVIRADSVALACGATLSWRDGCGFAPGHAGPHGVPMG